MAIKLDSGVLQALANPRKIEPVWTPELARNFADDVLSPWVEKYGGKKGVSDREKFDALQKHRKDTLKGQEDDRKIRQQNADTAKRRAENSVRFTTHRMGDNSARTKVLQDAEERRKGAQAALQDYRDRLLALRDEETKATLDMKSRGMAPANEKIAIARLAASYMARRAELEQKIKVDESRIANLDANTARTLQQMEIEQAEANREGKRWLIEDDNAKGHVMKNVFRSFRMGDRVSAEASLGLLMGGVPSDKITHIEYIQDPHHEHFDKIAYWFDDGTGPKQGSFSMAQAIRREGETNSMDELTAITQGVVWRKNEEFKQTNRLEIIDANAKADIFVKEISEGRELTKDERSASLQMMSNLPRWAATYGKSSLSKQQAAATTVGLAARILQTRDRNLNYLQAVRIMGEGYLSGSKREGDPNSFFGLLNRTTTEAGSLPNTARDSVPPRRERDSGTIPTEDGYSMKSREEFMGTKIVGGRGIRREASEQDWSAYVNQNYEKNFEETIKGRRPSEGLVLRHKEIFPTGSLFVEFLQKRYPQMRATEVLRLLELWEYPPPKIPQQ